jgi:hypothetical protein
MGPFKSTFFKFLLAGQLLSSSAGYGQDDLSNPKQPVQVNAAYPEPTYQHVTQDSLRFYGEAYANQMVNIIQESKSNPEDWVIMIGEAHNQAPINLMLYYMLPVFKQHLSGFRYCDERSHEDQNEMTPKQELTSDNFSDAVTKHRWGAHYVFQSYAASLHGIPYQNVDMNFNETGSYILEDLDSSKIYSMKNPVVDEVLEANYTILEAGSYGFSTQSPEGKSARDMQMLYGILDTKGSPTLVRVGLNHVHDINTPERRTLLEFIAASKKKVLLANIFPTSGNPENQGYKKNIPYSQEKVLERMHENCTDLNLTILKTISTPHDRNFSRENIECLKQLQVPPGNTN